jgi:hypothetical protein
VKIQTTYGDVKFQRTLGKVVYFEMECTLLKFYSDRFFATASRPVLGPPPPPKPPIQRVLGTLSPGLKRPGREADHSPPSCVEIKNAWRCTSTPHTSSWRDVNFFAI